MSKRKKRKAKPATEQRTNTSVAGSQNESVNTVIRFFSHPIVGMLVGAAVSLLFYYLSISRVEPKYAVSSSESVTPGATGSDPADAKFSGANPEKIWRTKLMLWNAGSRELEHRALSRSDPLRIEIPHSITLLKCRILKRSRFDLDLTVGTNSDIKNATSLPITLGENEALEPDDGIVLELTYLGSSTKPFEIHGRIKGLKSGFEVENWNMSFRRDLTVGILAHIIFKLVWTGIGAVMLVTEVVRFRSGKNNNLPLGCVLFFPLTLYSFYALKPYVLGLAWAR